MSAVDDYIDGLEPSEKAALQHIRSLVRALVPEVEEGTSYGMPAMKYKKKPLLGFIAAQHHLSVFPFSSEVIDATRDRLGGLSCPRARSDSPLPTLFQTTSLVTSSAAGSTRSTGPIAENVVLLR